MIGRDASGYGFRQREIIVVKGLDRQMDRDRLGVMGLERERERERENEILD